MRIDEMGVAMKLIQNDYYYIDAVYDRRPIESTDDKREIHHLWATKRGSVHYWQIGKALHIYDDDVLFFLFNLGIDPYEREDENSSTLMRISNSYNVFDGGAELREALYKKKIGRDEAGEYLGIANGRMRQIYDCMQLPTRDEIIKIAKGLDIHLGLWCELSEDVNYIVNTNLLPDLTFDYIANVEDLREYKKTLLIRYHLAYARLRLKLSFTELQNRTGIRDDILRQYEISMDTPNAEDAYKLSMALGLEQPADVYCARFYPANYMYLIKQQIKKRAALTKARYTKLKHGAYSGKLSEDVRKEMEKQMKKADHYAESITDRRSKYGELQ